MHVSYCPADLVTRVTNSLVDRLVQAYVQLGETHLNGSKKMYDNLAEMSSPFRVRRQRGRTGLPPRHAGRSGVHLSPLSWEEVRIT